jgi:hypothetical protein
MEKRLTCSRCAQNFIGYKTENATSGYYEISSLEEGWGQFAYEGETILCDECMWSDPRYIDVYGYHPVSAE